jgi:hypothetical protein
MGEVRNAYKIFVGKPEGKRPLLGRPSVCGRVILKSILGKEFFWWVWIGFIWLRLWTSGRLL